MQIKRTVEFTVTTNRRYIIRQSSPNRTRQCAVCGEPMLAAEQCAVLFSITQRRIFRLLESGAVHYIETATGSMLICLASLAEKTSGEMRKD